jgi:hypothetical protein
MTKSLGSLLKPIAKAGAVVALAAACFFPTVSDAYVVYVGGGWGGGYYHPWGGYYHPYWGGYGYYHPYYHPYWGGYYHPYYGGGWYGPYGHWHPYY